MLSLPTSRSLSAVLITCALLAPGTSASSTPSDQEVAALSGRVSRCVKLSLAQASSAQASSAQAWTQQLAGNGILANAEAIGPDVQIVLSGAAPTAAMRLVLPLEIRTNTAYELKLVLVSAEGCSPAIASSIDSIRPSGSWITAGAVDSAKGESLDLARCTNPTTLLRGRRVSAGGNFTSSGNALITELALSISASSQQCYWRIVARVSLQPTS